MSVEPQYGATAPLQHRANDRVFHKELDDWRGGQQARLYIPAPCRRVRAVLIDLGCAQAADRPDYQAFADHAGLAVLGTVLRWHGNDQVLERLLNDWAQQTGHPALAEAPWILAGFSRAAGAALRLVSKVPERVLAVLACGNPGVAIPLDEPDVRARFRHLPVCTVHSSDDPLVNKTHWATDHYRRLRQHDLPWMLALQHGWGHSHGLGSALALPWLLEILDQRLPPSGGSPVEPSGSGQWVGLADGWAPASAHIMPAEEYHGAPEEAVWLSSAYVAAIWRAIMASPSGPRLTLRDGAISVGNRRQWPAATTQVQLFDGDRALPRIDPLPVEAVGKGVHVVYAVLTGPGGTRTWTPPLLLIDGRAYGPDKGEPATQQIASAERLMHLSPPSRNALVTVLTQGPRAAAEVWTVACEDRFARDDFRPWQQGRLSNLSLKGGAMQVRGRSRALAFLPWSLPRNVAVSCEVRAVGRPAEAWVLLHCEADSPRPWHSGVLCRFADGGHRITAGDAWPAASSTGLAADRWHRIRACCGNDVVTVWIDGNEIARYVPPHTLPHGRQIGIGTCGGTVQVKNLRIEVQPYRPALSADLDTATLQQLLAELVALTRSRYSGQRRMARSMLAQLASAILADGRNDWRSSDTSDAGWRTVVEGLLPPQQAL